MQDYQSFLLSRLTDIKKRNPHYSLRAFAKSLDLSPSLLSMIINGKKKLTPKQAYKIIAKLGLNREETEVFLGGLLPSYIQMDHKTYNQRTLSEDEFKLISEWYHFAILSLGRLKNNKAQASWVSERLGIDRMLAMDALKRLERLGLIKVENNQFTQTNRSLTTSTDIPSQAIRSYHKQNLRLAEEKIETVDVKDREFSSTSLAIDPDQMAKAKSMINDFKLLLCRELETKDPKKVYTLAIQFFPVSSEELQ